MADDHQRAKEPNPKRTNTWIVALGLICVAGSIGYAAWEYDLRSREQIDATNAQTAAIKNQSLQKYYEQKLAAYSSATEAASKIAALKSTGAPAAQVQEAVTHFKTLVWGPVPISESRDVHTALALFNGALDADADAGQLQQLSLGLAQVCGNEAHDAFVAAGQTDPPASYGSDSVILSRMREVARSPQAQQAAGRWLALVDAGQYADSWKTASEHFQSTVTLERWERSTGDLRKLLGNIVSRKLRSADYSKLSPGAPDGDYMIMRYDTAFSGRSDSVETVTSMLDKDEQWRVSAYSIK